MTQYELAKKCGLSESTVSAAEIGRRGTRLKTIVQLCKGLNTSAEQLIQEAEGTESHSPDEASESNRSLFKELLDRHQESERALWLFLYDCLDSRAGRGKPPPGQTDPAGKPRARGRSRRKP